MLPSLTITLLVAASPLVLSRNVFSHFPRPDGNIVTASWATSSALSSSVTNPAAPEGRISEGATTAASLAVRSTTLDMTLQTISVATSAEFDTDWIIVMNDATTVPKFPVASTIVGPPMSAGDGSTYSLSASSTESQSPSSAIPRTGTFSISSYIPARPTSESLSTTSASYHRPPHGRQLTVPNIPNPKFGGPRRPGLRTSPSVEVLQPNTSFATLGRPPFRLWRTGPLFPWLRNSSDIYIPGSANSSTTDTPKACPVWYMFRGARRCAGSAWGMQPSKNTTLSAATKPSTAVAGHKPSLPKPAFSKSSPSAPATSSMASEAFSGPNAAKATPLGNTIRSRVVPTNSLVRELDLHCPYVRGRPRCGGRLSRSRTLETTGTSTPLSLAALTSSAAIV